MRQQLWSLCSGRQKVQGEEEGSMIYLNPTLHLAPRQAQERPLHLQKDRLLRRLRGRESPVMTCVRLSDDDFNVTQSKMCPCGIVIWMMRPEAWPYLYRVGMALHIDSARTVNLFLLQLSLLLQNTVESKLGSYARIIPEHVESIVIFIIIKS